MPGPPAFPQTHIYHNAAGRTCAAPTKRPRKASALRGFFSCNFLPYPLYYNHLLPRFLTFSPPSCKIMLVFIFFCFCYTC